MNSVKGYGYFVKNFQKDFTKNLSPKLRKQDSN